MQRFGCSQRQALRTVKMSASTYLGLSACKGTVAGVFVAGAVWLAFVLSAFALRSVSGGGETDYEEDESG